MSSQICLPGMLVVALLCMTMPQSSAYACSDSQRSFCHDLSTCGELELLACCPSDWRKQLTLQAAIEPQHMYMHECCRFPDYCAQMIDSASLSFHGSSAL